MRTGFIFLNPYAASYIPLARRGTDDANKDYSTIERGCKGGNETTWSGPQSVEATQNQYQSKASQNYGAYGKQSCENYALQGNPVHGSYGASSQNSKEVTEKQIPDEEYDMDLAYLQMTFPGISYESLSAVYFTNSGDLDATIDMLNHFEVHFINYYIISLSITLRPICLVIKSGFVLPSFPGLWHAPLFLSVWFLKQCNVPCYELYH